MIKALINCCPNNTSEGRYRQGLFSIYGWGRSQPMREDVTGWGLGFYSTSNEDKWTWQSLYFAGAKTRFLFLNLLFDKDGFDICWFRLMLVYWFNIKSTDLVAFSKWDIFRKANFLGSSYFLYNLTCKLAAAKPEIDRCPLIWDSNHIDRCYPNNVVANVL